MNDEPTNQSTDELLFQYVGLKAQVRALQHEMKDIYPQVLAAMKMSEEKRDIGGAVLSYQSRKNYRYSDQIQKISDELKTRKKNEIETGVAEVESITESVVVRFKKAEIESTN